ncbi:hypothetical protein HDU85_002558 [Gaertneriomyces sp. JEL0708]|nr:hypothetical protein HDU85_002558 [Gaertneriomyces sp. JEL0708]
MEISEPTGQTLASMAAAANSVADVKITKDTPVADFVFGSAAGMVGMLFQFPFDTVKVRLQSQPLSSDGRGALFRGPIDCFKQGIRKDGFMSLYKGLSAPLIGSMIENSALFVAFNHIQNIIRRASNRDPSESLTLPELALSGFLSGAFVSFILTPVELVKCKLQVQDVLYAPTSQSPATARSFQGPISVLSQVIRQHGLRGLYQGHMGTFLREAGGGAAWFGSYEYLCRKFLTQSQKYGDRNLTKDDLSTWQIMTAGALAGMCYNGALFPADSIKSRQQTTEGNSSFTQVARKLYQAEGIKGFYRGCGMTVLRSAPTSALIFATYELMSRHFSFDM